MDEDPDQVGQLLADELGKDPVAGGVGQDLEKGVQPFPLGGVEVLIGPDLVSQLDGPTEEVGLPRVDLE